MIAEPRIHNFDIVILGGGPSGLTCALECADSNLNHILLERKNRLGGQLFEVPGPIPNILAGNAHCDGSALAACMQEHAKTLPTNILTGAEVIEIDLKNKTLRTENDTYIYRSIYLALGARYREPVFKNLNQFKDYVHYKHYADQSLFVDKDVLIAGGGDSAFYAALSKAEVAKSITVVHRGKEFRARPDLVEQIRNSDRFKLITETEIISLEGKTGLDYVKAVNHKTGEIIEIKTDIVYTKFGYCPNTELFANQLEMDPSGHVIVGHDLSTSCPGVFAGGDMISPGYDRIAVASGHGALAVKSIRQYLEQVSA